MCNIGVNVEMGQLTFRLNMKGTFFCVFRAESTNDVRKQPISEKYNSLKDYLDSTGECKVPRDNSFFFFSFSAVVSKVSRLLAHHVAGLGEETGDISDHCHSNFSVNHN